MEYIVNSGVHMLATLGFLGAVGGTLVYLVTSMMILSVLRKKGEAVSIWLLPMRAFAYARMYKEGLGETDFAARLLYYLFYASYGTALISLLIMLIALGQKQ